MGMIRIRSLSDSVPTSAASGASPSTPLAVAPMERADAGHAGPDGGHGGGGGGAVGRAGPQPGLEQDGAPVGADELGGGLVGVGRPSADTSTPGGGLDREGGRRPEGGQLGMGLGQRRRG